MSSGTVGPDGCLYVSASDTLFKLTGADGRCVFAPTILTPTLSLTPASVSPSPAQGNATTFTATLHNVVQPQGTPITFAVNGANPQIKLVRADEKGQASFSYTGIITGTDTVTAAATVNTTRVTANRAQVTWAGGLHVTAVGLNQTATSGDALDGRAGHAEGIACRSVHHARSRPVRRRHRVHRRQRALRRPHRRDGHRHLRLDTEHRRACHVDRHVCGHRSAHARLHVDGLHGAGDIDADRAQGADDHRRDVRQRSKPRSHSSRRRAMAAARSPATAWRVRRSAVAGP